MTNETQPNEQQIRDAVVRILAGPTFRRSRRSSDFLRYIVEETLSGRENRLKGISVAIDVFGRQSDFDPHSDPLVRVEALRLRNRLQRHYLAEGAADPLRIELQRGSYVPAFRFANEQPIQLRTGSY